MNHIKLKEPLVSTGWLADHLGAGNLVVLDASLPKAGMDEDSLTDKVIRGARFMDLKNKWAEKDARFPNTMLSAKEFQQAARDLGLSNSSAIVVYDQHGIYSSARAWYMFRSMGHSNVAVLDGGLPAWEREGLPLEKKKDYTGAKGDFSSAPKTKHFVSVREVQDQLEDDNKLLLDARAEDRFYGRVEEPRAGLRSGHIPNSISLPFGFLQRDGHMKDEESLKTIFEDRAPGQESLICSCGSGITACVLALGAEIIGRKQVYVYDGSWTEWGSLPELPIE